MSVGLRGLQPLEKGASKGANTHSLTEYCDGFADFAYSGFDSVTLSLVGTASNRAFSSLQDELVFYADTLAAVGEGVECEFCHRVHG